MTTQSKAESIRVLPLDMARCVNATCCRRWRCFRFTSHTPPEAYRVVYSAFAGPDHTGECEGFIEAPKP